MQSVQQKIIQIIAEQAVLDVSEVPPDATLADLGIESLGLVEAIFAIEEAFDISVPFNANELGRTGVDLTSVASIVRAVEGLLAAKAA
jgi:acyl carrier protein